MRIVIFVEASIERCPNFGWSKDIFRAWATEKLMWGGCKGADLRANHELEYGYLPGAHWKICCDFDIAALLDAGGDLPKVHTTYEATNAPESRLEPQPSCHYIPDKQRSAMPANCGPQDRFEPPVLCFGSGYFDGTTRRRPWIPRSRALLIRSAG